MWNGTIWLMEQEDIPWASLEDVLAGISTTKFMSPAAMKAAIRKFVTPDYGMLRCVAWAIFNNTTGVISAQRNVSSITQSPASNSQLNFTNPLANADYLVHLSSIANSSLPQAASIHPTIDPTRFACIVTTGGTGGTNSVSLEARGPLTHFAAFFPPGVG